LENCGLLAALFVDIDFKAVQAHPNALPEDQSRALLSTFPLEPSIVVHTGGGLHVYWLLKDPLDLAHDATTANTYLRALARAVGGDFQAAEPARVLRLPDTLNYKYDPPRQVILEVCEPERHYTLADFDRVLGMVEPARVSGPVIPEGFRNTTLMSLAGTMRKRGMSEEGIRAALQAENRTRCDAPLGDDEVNRIVKSVLRYPSSGGTHLHRERKTRPAELPTFSPSDPSVEGRALLGDLDALLKRYVILTVHQRHVVALWVMHTHTFAAFETTPYLWVTSAMKQSGKTRLLEVLELVVAKPWLTGRLSAAVLVRKVDAEGPTLLLDETDAAFKAESDYTEAIRAILNSGYRYTMSLKYAFV
jgi:hypothetical protein